MDADFVLSPDLIVMRNTKSILGGLFSSENDQVKEVPHTLTPADLSTLLDYFDMIAFERFTAFLHTQPVLSSLPTEHKPKR